MHNSPFSMSVRDDILFSNVPAVGIAAGISYLESLPSGFLEIFSPFSTCFPL